MTFEEFWTQGKNTIPYDRDKLYGALKNIEGYKSFECMLVCDYGIDTTSCCLASLLIGYRMGLMCGCPEEVRRDGGIDVH